MSATPNSVPSASGQHPVLDHRRQRYVLIAMCTALVAVMASVSGLNVAQQRLAVDLGASQSGVLWIINAYTLALAALLMPIGAIGDRWGRKPVLLAGVALFGVASVGSMLAGSTATMIAARVAAGAAAAMIMPVTLSVLTSSFPPEDRGRAVGIWAGFAGSGGMIGLFTSAFALDALTWRWSFALPLALMAVSAALTIRFAPNSREESAHRVDAVGSVLSALAIGGLVLGIHEGPERGWSHGLTVAGLVVGAVALVAFVAWERRHEHPLLEVTAFRDRGLSSGTFTILAMFAAMFGVFLVVFPYFQAVLGWTALHSATALLPMAAMMMPMSAIAPRIAARIGSRATMMAGAATFAAGLATMALRASVSGGYMSVLPGLLVIGLGAGMAMTPATSAITETLPADKQGVASALNDTSRELGGAIGVALLGSVLTSGFRDSMRSALVGLPEALVRPASQGIGNAFGVAAQAGPAGPQIVTAAKQALVDGWVNAMWLGVAVVLVALLVLTVRGPVRPAAPAIAGDDRELAPVG